MLLLQQAFKNATTTPDWAKAFAKSRTPVILQRRSFTQTTSFSIASDEWDKEYKNAEGKGHFMMFNSKCVRLIFS